MIRKWRGGKRDWVTKQACEYVRRVRRVAVRCRKQDGQWGIGVLISTLTDTQVLSLIGQETSALSDPALLLACVYLYDQRGGGDRDLVQRR